MTTSITLSTQIKAAANDALQHLYPEAGITSSQLTVSQTKPEFTGDYTVVLFPFVKMLRLKSDALGNALGEYLLGSTSLFESFAIVSGFLNLTVKESWWPNFLINHFNDEHFGELPNKDERVMIEYSSPNTNKPLHFGHLRNIFLGAAVSNVIAANGKQVVKANLVNNRGIHICKSMVAWQRYGKDASPQSTGIKGDHLVGDYYVRYNDEYKKEVAQLVAEGHDVNTAEKKAPILHEAQDLLRSWEAEDEGTRKLWRKMNDWVYAGFKDTYHRMGILFDKYYYESDTYLLGKAIVEEGLQKGILFKKEDGSVWIDLTADGLDQKLLLRADGTSVYMTQDLGTARLKYNDYHLNTSAYVIADEQNYHMQVLKLILEKLNEPCASGIYHISYGMVELPTGKMKSREGTVVDADDMINEMVNLAKEQTEAAGKTEGFTETELADLYEMIGLGALKFYLLRVEPKKKMVFDPKESIDLHGYTATFIQYAHARICSVMRREELPKLPSTVVFQAWKQESPLLQGEKELIRLAEQYPTILENAGEDYNPSLICNYAFSLAQLFNTHYEHLQVAKAESQEKKELRLMLFVMVAQTLRHSMNLLGIRLPEKM